MARLDLPFASGRSLILPEADGEAAIVEACVETSSTRDSAARIGLGNRKRMSAGGLPASFAPHSCECLLESFNWPAISAMTPAGNRSKAQSGPPLSTPQLCVQNASRSLLDSIGPFVLLTIVPFALRDRMFSVKTGWASTVQLNAVRDLSDAVPRARSCRRSSPRFWSARPVAKLLRRRPASAAVLLQIVSGRAVEFLAKSPMACNRQRTRRRAALRRPYRSTTRWLEIPPAGRRCAVPRTTYILHGGAGDGPAVPGPLQGIPVSTILGRRRLAERRGALLGYQLKLVETQPVASGDLDPNHGDVRAYTYVRRAQHESVFTPRQREGRLGERRAKCR